MALLRWDPFRDLLSFQEEMNRWFSRRFFGAEGGVTEATWSPVLDVCETENEVLVTVDVPGIDPKDVNITLEDDTLVIEGERKFSKEVKEEDYLRIERRYGKFRRSIPLGRGIDRDKISASFDKGVLEVKLPKTEELKPKRVKIEVKEKK